MPQADLLLTDTRIRTLNPHQPEATALAVKDGRIAALGDTATLTRDWSGPGTERLSLAGATVTPGFVDSHSHPVWGLQMSAGADLTGVQDLDALRAALRSAPRIDGWVIGWGLDHNAFGGRPVHHGLIEDVLDGAPAFLRLYDGHSALASTAALAAAQVTGPREFAQRAEIVCDAEGRPTGHLIEHAAMDVVDAVVPRLSYEKRRAGLVDLLKGMAATGLTGAHVMDGADLELLAAVEQDTDLPLRLTVAPWCMPGVDQDGLDELIALQKRGGRDWRVGAVKFFMDGTVEGGTAWLEQADCHGRGTDAFWPDPQAYSDAVRTLHAAGVRTATHAIGDAAVRHALDTIEALGASGRDAHRIEHIETVPDDTLPRFAALGVAASMQPPHTAYTKGDHSDEWSQRLGAERAGRAWRTRDLRDAGAVLALGSDWPIAHFDARRVLAMARVPEGAAGAGQGLSGLEALEGVTSHAAIASGEAHLGGRIEVGLRADLTVLGLDPVLAPADELAQAPVRLTTVGGRIVHRGE
ncbi:amidohydrolase [Streptomyces xanthii]|uniref:Amidohydrolase n=1 Tax=Streptomyces xanthii TaxID=2768069 RepID=A0A7H1BD05_9ACTN|nr:amidohydrolase [Streptomyces xanthii]QNS06610.1 amidohydrolase [Streptomyces xanthii]